MATKKKPASAPTTQSELLTDVAEETAVETYWHAAGRSKLRKPPKHYSYIEEIAHPQFELIKLQEWVRLQGLKVVVLFEGRDAAGKGGVIKRITDSLNPRICRVAALGTPTERERGQWYFRATSRICRRVARSCCSIAAGTTARAWNASWGFARTTSTKSSCALRPCSRRC